MTILPLDLADLEPVEGSEDDLDDLLLGTPLVVVSRDLQEAVDDPKHPRWPKGTPGGLGGEFKPSADLDLSAFLDGPKTTIGDMAVGDYFASAKGVPYKLVQKSSKTKWAKAMNLLTGKPYPIEQHMSYVPIPKTALKGGVKDAPPAPKPKFMVGQPLKGTPSVELPAGMVYGTDGVATATITALGGGNFMHPNGKVVPLSPGQEITGGVVKKLPPAPVFVSNMKPDDHFIHKGTHYAIGSFDDDGFASAYPQGEFGNTGEPPVMFGGSATGIPIPPAGDPTDAAGYKINIIGGPWAGKTGTLTKTNEDGTVNVQVPGLGQGLLQADEWSTIVDGVDAPSHGLVTGDWLSDGVGNVHKVTHVAVDGSVTLAVGDGAMTYTAAQAQSAMSDGTWAKAVEPGKEKVAADIGINAKFTIPGGGGGYFTLTSKTPLANGEFPAHYHGPNGKFEYSTSIAPDLKITPYDPNAESDVDLLVTADELVKGDTFTDETGTLMKVINVSPETGEVTAKHVDGSTEFFPADQVKEGLAGGTFSKVTPDPPGTMQVGSLTWKKGDQFKVVTGDPTGIFKGLVAIAQEDHPGYGGGGTFTTPDGDKFVTLFNGHKVVPLAPDAPAAPAMEKWTYNDGSMHVSDLKAGDQYKSEGYEPKTVVSNDGNGNVKVLTPAGNVVPIVNVDHQPEMFAKAKVPAASGPHMVHNVSEMQVGDTYVNKDGGITWQVTSISGPNAIITVVAKDADSPAPLDVGDSQSIDGPISVQVVNKPLVGAVKGGTARVASLPVGAVFSGVLPNGHVFLSSWEDAAYTITGKTAGPHGGNIQVLGSDGHSTSMTAESLAGSTKVVVIDPGPATDVPAEPSLAAPVGDAVTMGGYVPFKSPSGPGGSYKHDPIGQMTVGAEFVDKKGQAWMVLEAHGAKQKALITNGAQSYTVDGKLRGKLATFHNKPFKLKGPGDAAYIAAPPPQPVVLPKGTVGGFVKDSAGTTVKVLSNEGGFVKMQFKSGKTENAKTDGILWGGTSAIPAPVSWPPDDPPSTPAPGTGLMTLQGLSKNANFVIGELPADGSKGYWTVTEDQPKGSVTGVVFHHQDGTVSEPMVLQNAQPNGVTIISPGMVSVPYPALDDFVPGTTFVNTAGDTMIVESVKPGAGLKGGVTMMLVNGTDGSKIEAKNVKDYPGANIWKNVKKPASVEQFGPAGPPDEFLVSPVAPVDSGPKIGDPVAHSAKLADHIGWVFKNNQTGTEFQVVSATKIKNLKTGKEFYKSSGLVYNAGSPAKKTWLSKPGHIKTGYEAFKALDGLGDGDSVSLGGAYVASKVDGKFKLTRTDTGAEVLSGSTSSGAVAIAVLQDQGAPTFESLEVGGLFEMHGALWKKVDPFNAKVVDPGTSGKPVGGGSSWSAGGLVMPPSNFPGVAPGGVAAKSLSGALPGGVDSWAEEVAPDYGSWMEVGGGYKIKHLDKDLGGSFKVALNGTPINNTTYSTWVDALEAVYAHAHGGQPPPVTVSGSGLLNKPAKKISGFQLTPMKIGKTGVEYSATLKDLDLAPGDVIQAKKGGWKYELVAQTLSGSWTAKNVTSGKPKTIYSSSIVAFVKKADKSPVKLKEAALPGGAPKVEVGTTGSGAAFYKSLPVGTQVVVKQNGVGGWGSQTFQHLGNAKFVLLPGGGGSGVNWGSMNYLVKVVKPGSGTIKVAAPVMSVPTIKGKLKAPDTSTPVMSALPEGTVIESLDGKVAVLKPSEPAYEGYVTAYDIATGTKFEPPAGKQPVKFSADADVMDAAAAQLAKASTVKTASVATPSGHSAQTTKSGPPPQFSGIPVDYAATELVSNWFAGKQGLTGAERSAVKSYTASGYGPINEALRNSTGVHSLEIANQVKRLDSAIAKQKPFAQPVILSRKTSLPQWTNNAKVGSVIQDNGFLSSSTNGGTWSGSVRLKALIPAGAKGLWVDDMSSNSGEAEVILPRGSQFHILKREETSGSGVTLYVEMIV